MAFPSAGGLRADGPAAGWRGHEITMPQPPDLQFSYIIICEICVAVASGIWFNTGHGRIFADSVESVPGAGQPGPA